MGLLGGLGALVVRSLDALGLSGTPLARFWYDFASILFVDFGSSLLMICGTIFEKSDSAKTSVSLRREHDF